MQVPADPRSETFRLSAGALGLRLSPRGARLMRLDLAGCDAPLTEVEEDAGALDDPANYHGAVVGPVANRIAGAAAVLDGRRLRFEANEGPNLLHGGSAALNAMAWDVADVSRSHAVFRLRLGDGLGGFPGTRDVEARYDIEPPAALRLTLSATTDAPTLMNLANHSYWRLGAAQRLVSPAFGYLPVDEAQLPTGEIAPVDGTRFDFRAGRPVGGQGYDHCLCLARARRGLAVAAILEGGGLRMTLETTEPGLQVYDGLAEGVALEPQGWPDAPNRPGFPPVRLDPGQTYRQVTRWSFARS